MTRSFGKIWKRRFFSWFVSAIFVAVCAGPAFAESAVVLQGFQTQADKYAANTVDAYVKALQVREATVTALRPQSQPGWEGGSSYTDKGSLLSQVRGVVAGQVTVAVIVGDTGTGGGLLTGNGEEASASEIADALSGAKRVSIVSAGCNALAAEVASRLATSDIVISGVATGQSAHTWPKGNRGQYDLFSRYLLEGYYLLASDAGVSGSTGELLGRAAGDAARRTTHRSGGRQTPTLGDTYGSAGSDGGLVARVGNREYAFSLQANGGSLSGYVANALGLPIAPVRSGTVNGDRLSFTFSERGRDRSVVVSGGNALAVSIDGRPVTFGYLPSSIDLVAESRVIGRAYVTADVSGEPKAEVYSVDGSVSSGGPYSPSDRSFSFSVSGTDFVLQIGALGALQATVAGRNYHETDVFRYGLYDDSGERTATAVAVTSGTEITGTLTPEAGEMRLPLSGALANGEMSGSATLVGNTYTLSEGWKWTSSRPPSSGIVQPDYLGLPELERVYADASRGDGAVAITWTVDRSKVSGGILLSDLSFQILRTEGASGVTERFDVPAGRRTYTDRPSGDPSGYTYALRAVLDHRVTSCDNSTSYPILGDHVTARPGTPPAEPVVMAASPVAPSAPAPQAEATPSAAPEDAQVVASAPEPVVADKEVERVSEPEPKEEPEKKKEEEEDEDVFRPWEKKEEKGGIASRVIYGVLGVMIIVGIAIAIGGGGSPNDLEPN